MRSEPAVTVLRGARLGLDAVPGTVVVAGERIRSAGPVRDSALTVRGARVIDLGGATVLPGLWDAHVHMDSWSLVSHWIDLTATGGPDQVVGLVADRLRAAGPPRYGLPLVGYGYRDALWRTAPRREQLDAVSTELPLVMVGWDLHQVWCNTAALQRYGWPPGSEEGVIREDAWLPIAEDLRAVPAALLDGWVAEAAAAAAARGVVGIVDFESTDTPANWARRAAAGPLALRVRVSAWPDRLSRVIEAGLRTGDPVPGTGGLVSMGPLKVISDGSLNTRTAYCDQAYPGEPDNRGRLVVPPSDLVPLMRRATAHGIDCAVHAIGDHANALALDAFAATDARGSIEHAQLLRHGDAARFARLGVVASVQPEHALDDRDVADRSWAGRTDRAFPLADLHRHGVRLTFGSDAPVAPLDPWVAIAAAVSRRRGDRPAWHPEQQLDLATAVASSTSTGRTVLQPGDPADLIVLASTLTGTDPEALRTAPVAGTMVAGRWTWRDGI